MGLHALFLVQNNLGTGFRVVRKGFHFLVESRRRNGEWEDLYRVPIGQEPDADLYALKGAVRKALFYAEDFQLDGQILNVLEAEKEALDPSKLLSHPIALITHLPRDAALNARIPRPLKDRLVEETRKLERLTKLQLTLSDYLIYRLRGSGGDVN